MPDPWQAIVAAADGCRAADERAPGGTDGCTHPNPPEEEEQAPPPPSLGVARVAGV
jgi:hypothetical protein